MKTCRLLALLVIFFACSFSAFADTYSLTFTADLGSTGGALTAVTSPITSGPITIDWATDVFTLSAPDFSDVLSDCAPLSATPTACATYSASDAGVFLPKLNVGPLLGINDDGGAQASFTLLASSANKGCAPKDAPRLESSQLPTSRKHPSLHLSLALSLCFSLGCWAWQWSWQGKHLPNLVPSPNPHL